MAQAPQQQIQVIQPLNGTQLQQLYMPQQQMVYSGHLSGSTLQQISPAAGVSFHIQPKGSMDSKTYGAHNVQPHQRILLQPKPHYTSLQGHSTVQVFNGTNLNQMPQRQIISAQAPGSMYSQPQMLGSYALSPLPPGYSWASTSFSPQSPFIIRTPQPNIYVQQSQPQTSMHMSMPVQASPQAVPPISFSDVCQETQTITTETLIPSATQSVISCSTIPANVPPNSVTTTLASIIPKQSSNLQANMYSAPTTPNQANQYSQSFIPNQANQPVTYSQVNQSIVSIAHPTNQPVDSATHNPVNQPIEYINHNPVNQTVESSTTNPINQPMGSVSHNSLNLSMGPVIHNQSNQYSESQNDNAGVQYTEAPIPNPVSQSVEPVICNQNEQVLESQNRGKLIHSSESQVDQHSTFVNVKNSNSADPKKSFALSTKCGIKTEQSGEVLIPPSPLSKEYRLKVLPQEMQQLEDLPAQDSPASANGRILTPIAEPLMTVSSSSPSNLNNSTVQTHSMKSFVETYSYTVVSPTSSGQSDMSPEKDNVQKVGTDFYPIIKLKRLKPQDPLGKQDSVEKHPQKAIVKPQMLALPDSYLLQAQPESFSESLKSVSHTSHDSLPIKKRKLPAEMDNFPDSSTNYLGYISPATVQRGRGRGRGRGQSSTSGTPKKLGRPRKNPVQPISPVIATTPVPPVTIKQEVIDQNALETRRSARQKAKIEVIELIDDNNDTVKTENQDSSTNILRNHNIATTGNNSPSNNSRTQDRIESKSGATEYNIGGHMKATHNKDNIGSASNNAGCWNADGNQNITSESPSTSKAIPFELGNCKLKQDMPLHRMSVQEVCEFVCSFPGCLEYGEVFKSQEIDGQALLLLNLDHLMTGFCMKLGPAVKLISYINSQKEEDI